MNVLSCLLQRLSQTGLAVAAVAVVGFPFVTHLSGGSALAPSDDFVTGGGWITGTPTGARANFGVKDDEAGYYTGTNVRGLVTKFSYSPTDSLILSFKWYLTELIDVPVVAPGTDAESAVNRFQVDAVLKF